VADIRDLTAKMEMQQLEAVGHVVPLQFIKGLQDFRHRQAEFRAIATRALPAARPPAANLMRMPTCANPDFGRVVEDQFQLGVFLDNRNDLRSTFWASIAISMNSASLNPLQMIGVSTSVIATTANNSGLLPASNPKPNGRLYSRLFSTTWRLLIDLDRVDARVGAAIVVFADRLGERVVDFPQAILQDAIEPDEHRQVETAGLEPLDQLLHVDKLRRILGRMNQHVAIRG
jgi:hypothetical protein